MNLNYKTLGGDLLVFKNNNDCMTIHRGVFGHPDVFRIEIDGEDLPFEECDYDLIAHPKNTFTDEEVTYYLKAYDEIVGPNY